MTKGGCDTGYTGSQGIVKGCCWCWGCMKSRQTGGRMKDGSDCSPPLPGQLDRGPKLGGGGGEGRRSSGCVPDGDESSSSMEVPQDLFDICDMQCPPPHSGGLSGWASDEQRSVVTQASGRMEEGSSCFENPYRQSINISSLARLGTAYEPNGTQTQGKGTLNVAATPGARRPVKGDAGHH